MLSIILFVLLFNLQKFIHELGHLVMAKRAGIVVEEFGFGYRPRVAKLWQRKGTIFTLNWLLIGCFTKMLEDKDVDGSFASKSKATRFGILIVGPILNLVTLFIFLIPAIILFTLANMAGVPEPVTGIGLNGEEAAMAQTIITEVGYETPADEAGLQNGDVILGADGNEFRYVGDLVTYVEKTKGTEIILRIGRGNERLDVPIVPRRNPPENQGAMGIGITYEAETNINSHPLPRAFVKGVTDTAEYISLTFFIPIGMYRGIIPNEALAPASAIEIQAQATRGLIEGVTYNRWFQTFWLLGILSLSVMLPIVLTTIISLLPLPKWDSWRIIALLIER